MSSSEGYGLETTASLPPFNNAPQISKVDASNDSGAICKMTSSGPRVAKSLSSTSRSTALWGTTTPLGRPVDPDVYMTYATSSGAISGQLQASPAERGDPVSA